jgi:hypothetical protein
VSGERSKNRASAGVGEDLFDHSGSGELDRVIAEELLVQLLDGAHDLAGVPGDLVA